MDNQVSATEKTIIMDQNQKTVHAVRIQSNFENQEQATQLNR